MIFEEDFKIIKKLAETQSCTGNEANIRQLIIDLVEDYCDKIEVDVLGNLFCYIEGKKSGSDTKKRVLLDAHLDEIGFMVRFIDKNGFIRFSSLGGQNARILPGQNVTIHSSSGEEIMGIIAEKAIHLLQKDERTKVTKIVDLFIDIGLSSEEEVKKHVSVGDYITLKQECYALLGNNRIVSKAFDDRIGCFVLIRTIMELSPLKKDLDKDIIFLFAAQEEIGVRGATVGAFKINPDFAITLEVTHAIDYPGISKEKHYDCYLGCGVSIALGPNFYPKLTKALIDIAKEEQIPFILEAEPYPSPNDARAIQMTRSGIPCALIALPLRYMHTNVEMIEYKDALHAIQLVKSFLLKEINFKLD